MGPRSCLCTGLVALGPYCQDLGADDLPVRPSHLVDKIHATPKDPLDKSHIHSDAIPRRKKLLGAGRLADNSLLLRL